MSKGKPQLPAWLTTAIAAHCAPARERDHEPLRRRGEGIGRHPRAPRVRRGPDRRLLAPGGRPVPQQPRLLRRPAPGIPVPRASRPDADLAEPVPRGRRADQAGDLAKARRLLFAQTQNAINGATDAAKRKREVFEAFYEQVKPLLAPGKTVRDVIPLLAVKAA